MEAKNTDTLYIPAPGMKPVDLRDGSLMEAAMSRDLAPLEKLIAFARLLKRIGLSEKESDDLLVAILRQEAVDILGQPAGDSLQFTSWLTTVGARGDPILN